MMDFLPSQTIASNSGKPGHWCPEFGECIVLGRTHSTDLTQMVRVRNVETDKETVLFLDEFHLLFGLVEAKGARKGVK